jgi:hypothetical protein
VKQESIPWQSFVFDAGIGHSRFETPRSALVAQAFLPVFFRGWAMAILISDNCATAVVSLILPTLPDHVS